MNSFNFKIPQNILFGMGSLNQLPDLLAESQSSHVFLISDGGLAKLGVVEKLEGIIKGAGITCTTYLGVVPNPTVAVVNEATALYKSCGATSIVALGGGSSMDVAKAVGVLANYGGEITQYEGNFKVPGPIVPMIAIPTTAGTGSEVTASAVITDESRNYKLSVFSYEILPKYALLDPALIMTAPASIAAACGVDALIHSMEAYVSTKATPFSDAMAEKAMELIGGHLRRFVANRQDEEAACAMMLGSNFAGISFAWARLGNVHAMSHPVSGYFHVAHGVANSILLPTVLEYNALADHGRYKKMYNYIHQGAPAGDDFQPMDLVEEIRRLNAELGIPAHLADAGVTAEKIPAMAADAMKSGNIPANPRQTTLKDIIALYEKAL
ncbi:MAG: iron-containing alcohol dehydrogenase [Gemmiger sp.]